MKKLLLILVGLFLVLSGLYIFMQPQSFVAEVRVKADYEAVMTEDVAYLYFGRDTCSYCREFEPLMNEAIQETGTKVYKYDTDKHKNDGDFQDILDANEVKTVPKLVRLEKGVVTDYVDHTHTQAQITALLTEN
ncbi:MULTISPECIES: thioredoxin family protein [unclassified Jeotgalibaca]|uniref:thioredoxin family protein n=1 Tax=unclassified Jeotgalibaca TaxID=2621505 RepID=UPI003FD5705C